MKIWKESASIILAAHYGLKSKVTVNPSLYDYHILTMKRHKDSSYVSGYYVFPGGVIESADASCNWPKLYSELGFNSNSFKSLLPNTKLRPLIFKNENNKLPREISLRITAIREMFEECGILLCKRPSKSNKLEWAEHLSVPQNEIEIWRSKVHKDAAEFYKLCESLQFYPDLWALHEWSNWMTPTFYNPKRFDTAFFLACMASLPRVKHDPLEMEDSKWENPKAYIFPKCSLLPFVQYYEIGKIANFECLQNLLEFAVDRSKIGVQLQLPVSVILKDGIVNLLPGDSMYPKEVSLSEKQVLDKSIMTIIEFRKISEVINRLEKRNCKMDKYVVLNYKSMDGHMSPIFLNNTS